MHVVDSYKNLLIEIEIVRKRIEGLEVDRELMVKSLFKSAPKEISSVNYDGMPKGSMSHKTLDRTWEDIRRIDNMLFLENTFLENKLKIKNQIEERIGKLEGIEYKVAFMKDIKGKNLKEIAEELGYSHEHIRRIYSKAKNATLMLHTNEN